MEEFKYKTIYETLKTEILGGKYSSGHRFPSEAQLIRRFGGSRITVIHALQELSRLGLIVRRKGQGSFLSRRAANYGRSIGLIVPISRGEIFPPICREVTRLAQQDGYSIHLADLFAVDAGSRVSEARRIAEGFAAQNMMGVIFHLTDGVADAQRMNDAALSVFDSAGIPVVLTDCDLTVRPIEGDATAALQKAFDDCFLAGGGTVTVEKGEYAVGGLRLRSNTTLLLKSGAVLKASRNCDDYDILSNDRIEPVPEGDFAPGVVWVTPSKRKTNDHILKCASRWNNAVIRILRARNVRVIGEPGSVIDGCDSYDPVGEEHFRGVHGVSVHDSVNCTFRGYMIRNTGSWAHNVWRSSDLGFEDLTILGGHDGIHITTCDRVRIAQCTMKTGDDCVSGFDNEDVTVRGCSLNTACSAFRFGGRRVLVEDCRAWGPAEYPIRNSLPKADQIAGSHGKPGAGWRTLLALFTYYSDFTVKVRRDPGAITVRNCRVENAQRFLHYNFSGNETWQKNRPLRSIRFENVEAAGLALSLCAYGDAESKLSLALKDCRLSFAKPQRELVRAAHVEALSMDGVCVEGVDGPCARSWGDVAVPELRDFAGAEPNVVEADEPFRVNPI